MDDGKKKGKGEGVAARERRLSPSLPLFPHTARVAVGTNFHLMVQKPTPSTP